MSDFFCNVAYVPRTADFGVSFVVQPVYLLVLVVQESKHKVKATRNVTHRVQNLCTY
jgi:hypothetical protein